MLVGEYLTTSAQRFPEKHALIFGQQRFSYRSLADSVRSLAGFFIANGLQVGDRVIVLLDNSPETVISIFAVVEAGGCLVSLHPSTTPDRLGYIISNCTPRFLIASGLKSGAIAQAEQPCSSPPQHIFVGREGTTGSSFDFDEICKASHADQAPPINEEDIAAIIYTSGSTGKPKGVTLTHYNISIVTDAVTQYLEHTSDDIILDFLPLSIGYGLLQLWVTLRNGGTFVLEKGFGYPYEIIKRIKEEKVTGFAAVPTVYSVFINLRNLEQKDFPHVRYITNAAAAMPAPFVPKLRKIFSKTKIYLMHGLTECLRTTYLPPDQIDRRPTSVGQGMPYVRLWIEDAQGNGLAPGEVGEMVVSGPNIMKGYWNDPESTARVVRTNSDGEKILRTGDLFTVDEEGFFYFVGRVDDMIKSRGKKVSPLEIEDTIYLLDGVLEVRVIGVPDELLGQAIKAEIVIKKDLSLTDVQVKAHCQRHLEDFQIPHVVQFVASLPKSAGGKIKRVA